MGPLLKAEFIKARSTRATIGLVIGGATVASLGAVSTIASGEVRDLTGGLHEQQYHLLASINLGLFALIGGIRLFTDEFRHGTIVPTLLLAPDRRRVLAAKAITGASFGALLVATAYAVMCLVAVVVLSTRGIDVGWSSADVSAFAGITAAGALWGVIGVAVGATVRHQVAATVGGVVWVLVVENLGTGFLGDIGPYLPGQAAHALARVSAIGGGLLDPVVASAVLLAYALAAVATASTALIRHDIAVA
ncbi:MAG TPA: hypothetical protein VEC15_03610 [Actinomycetota bacterium]|nr:hypothetical protein [Actinomycetota bacterium]